MHSDRIAVIASDLAAASEMRDLIGRCSPFHELHTVDTGDAGRFPDFLHSLAASPPYAVFAEVRGFEEIAGVLEPIKAADPFLPVVIFFRNIDNNAYLELQRMGMPFLVHLPSSPGCVARILSEITGHRAVARHVHAAQGPMVSFVPAKPGSGASTAAWHFTHACAAHLGKRIAMVDLDTICGVQALFANMASGASLFDAISVADHTGELPPDYHIPSAGGIHIFAASRRCRSARIDSAVFGNFLDVIRRRYPLVVLDHSGNWERFSVEGMKDSRLVLCVASGDYVSLVQVRSAVALFEEDGLAGKTRLLVTRHGSRFSADSSEAERMAGLKLAACLPNCYGALQRAIGTGFLISGRSEYAAAMAAFAARVLADLELPLDGAGPLPAANLPAPRNWLTAIGLSRREPAPAATHGIVPRR